MTVNVDLSGIPRALLLLGGGACAVIVLAGLRSAAGIIAPVFFAVVLTIAVFPLRGIVERRGLPVWLGGLIAVLTVYLILGGLTVALVLACGQLATLLPEYQQQFDDLMAGLQRTLGDLGVAPAPADAVTDSLNPGKLVDSLINLLSDLLGVLTGVTFIVTVLLFIGLDAVRFRDRFVDARVDHPAMARAVEQFARGSRQYLVVATEFGLLIAVLDLIVLYVLDVPSPLLWALLAFITGYIPNIGFLIGVIPPALLALLDGGLGLMAAVVISYVVINSGIQTILQPRIVGQRVGLSATVSFLSLVFWGYVLGAYGALMAVPLTLFVKAFLVDVDDQLRWLSPMISGHPADPAPDGPDA